MKLLRARKTTRDKTRYGKVEPMELIELHDESVYDEYIAKGYFDPVTISLPAVYISEVEDILSLVELRSRK